MEQFSLEKYLENPNCKIVTRDGRQATILKCNAENTRFPIIGTIITNGIEEPYSWTENGGTMIPEFGEIQSDIFFANEENGLTEFERELEMMMVSFSNGNLGSDVRKEMPKQMLHDYAHRLLDLARKEILEEFRSREELFYKNGFEIGRESALKDLPKLRKDCFHNITSVVDGRLYYNGYYIDINELEKLPKED